MTLNFDKSIEVTDWTSFIILHKYNRQSIEQETSQKVSLQASGSIKLMVTKFTNSFLTVIGKLEELKEITDHEVIIQTSIHFNKRFTISLR